MLDQNDLRAIESLFLASERRLDERFAKVDERFAKVDERFDSMQKQMDERFAKVDERFDSMQKQMDERFAKVDERFDSMQKQMDERFAAQDAKMEERILASETMLLEEMDRMDRKNERRFSKLEKDIAELKEIYRMTKNENDTIQMILHIQEDMEKRLTAVEQKIA